jgi:hypothetical protein
LKNIYDHGSVVGQGIKREGGSMPGSGTRTPLQMTQLTSGPNAGALVPVDVAYRGSISGNGNNGSLDPHQSAALAMAEMQQQQQQQQQNGIAPTPNDYAG